jgi:cytochrome c oxidase subunit 2
VAILACVVLLAGCANQQSTLHADSEASKSIETLWWVLFALSTVVVSVVTLLVLAALLKRRGRLDRFDRRHASPVPVLIAGAAIPAVILVALFAYALSTLDATSEPAAGTTRMTIVVTGKQWFWDVRYPHEGIRTANELHIPVGVPVRIEARTDDVIHSFWVPRLNRKIDMIPGYENAIVLEADRAGTYRGQCAEYCGLQHANMAFYVIAESPARFSRWVGREQRRPPASAPGAAVFKSVGCGGCHRIAGVSSGDVGPDLTHVASRRTLAAGTFPNARGWLGGWILDPQHLKPGNKMPALPVRGAQLQQLLDYLESLK